MTRDVAVEMEGLTIAAERSIERARGSGTTRWLALRAALPATCAGFDALRAFESASVGSEAVDERFYWEQPQEGHARVAFGVSEAIETVGDTRFADASQALGELIARVDVVGDPAPAEAGPSLAGGFTFAGAGSTSRDWSGFPPARLVLPDAQLVRVGAGSFASVMARIDPTSSRASEPERLAAGLAERLSRLIGEAEKAASTEPWRTAASVDAPEYVAGPDHPHADYRARVTRALASIAEGALEKVVVARSVRVAQRGPVEVGPFLEALRSSYPSCVSFAIARAGRVFLGATPERLVRLAGVTVETAAVAGSAPRGATPQRDAELGRALRESKKEQAEHAFVVRAIRSALEPVCATLDGPEAPRLLRVEGIQHLETPLVGRLGEERGAANVIDLVARLHPTPAVGGAPREAALDWIARNEGLDRGWYAAPVGWVDVAGGGEFRVALRSALVDNRGSDGSARLYAGSGIVAGSDPERELRETRLKLRALLSPLLDV